MKKKYILLLLWIIFGLSLSAQKRSNLKDKEALNNISISIIGHVSLISTDYERQIPLNSNLFLATKAGFGYKWDSFLWPTNYMTIPHSVSLNFGKESKFFEFGIGGTSILRWHNKELAENYYYLYPSAAYRKHFSECALFRVFLSYPILQNYPGKTLFINTHKDLSGITFVPIGFSFGFRF